MFSGTSSICDHTILTANEFHVSVVYFVMGTFNIEFNSYIYLWDGAETVSTVCVCVCVQVQKVQICSSITCHKSSLTMTWLSCSRRLVTFCRRRFTSTSKQILANVLVCQSMLY